MTLFKGLAKPRKIKHSRALAEESEDYNEIKERARSDFRFFAKTFFAHHCSFDFSEMHEDFFEMEKIPDRLGCKEAIAAPRGNAKTTFKVLLKSLHAIAYGYHKFILIIGYSSAEAIDKVKDIRNELLSNERFIEVYGLLADPKSAQNDFVTSNGVRVTARSKGGQVRGLKFMQHRPSLIILDDIEDLESVNTPEQRKKTEDWFFKDVMGAGSADGNTDITIVGTILHTEGLLAKLLKTPAWLRSKYQAIKSWATRQDLWKQWEEIYCDLSNPNAQADATAFYERNAVEMLEGVEVLWEAGEPYLKLMQYKIEYGLASLYSEKQNDPFDPDRQVLNPDICKRFKVMFPDDPRWPKGQHRDGFKIFMDGVEYLQSSQLDIIAFHDPALTEEKKSDYSAIAVCGQDSNGYIYVLDCYLKRDNYTNQIKRSYDLWRKWNPHTLYLETVGFQQLLKPLYYQEEQAQKTKIRIVGVQQHQNKVHRISTMEPYFSNGWLRFNEDINPLLLDQLRLFPTGHDDGPDALHGCVNKLKRPGGGIKSVKEGTIIR